MSQQQNLSDIQKPSDNTLGECASSPSEAKDLRVNQQIRDALSAIPGGDNLDRYFGISSGEPQQPKQEARIADQLIDELREGSSTGGDLGDLLKRISIHADNSGADPDALRALMRGSRKGQPKEGRNNEE
jgi:hypothetical protein